MRTSDYWRERFVQLEAAQNRLAENGRQQIERLYRQAQRELDGQIRVWYQRLASNNEISLAEARRWLTADELAEFKWDVQEYIKFGRQNAIDGQWARQLENASAKFHISRLEALKIRTRQSLETLFAKQQGVVGQTLGEVYRSGYYHTAFELQKGFSIGWDIAAVDERRLKKVLAKPWAADGRNFSERIWGSRDKLVSELHTELTRNIMLGQDPQSAIEAIAKKMNTSRVNAGRLVMTEEAYFSSVAQRDCFHDLGVEKFEIVATLDSHTSEICQELDGQVRPMSDYEPGVTAPPFHVNCRSTTVPYFDDEFSLGGERAARGEDGKTYYVPADMKYKEWQAVFVNDGDKTGLQEVGESGIIKRDYDSEFAQKFGKEHYDQIRNQVDACGNADLQKIWAEYERNITVGDSGHKGTAYCSGSSIYLNIEAVAKGNSYHTPYATLFHETGHAIDGLTYQLGIANGQWHFSSTYQNGLFPQTIKAEVDDWVKSILADMKAHNNDWDYWVAQGWIDQRGADFFSAHTELKVTKSMAYAAVQRKISSLNLMQYADISDILEGAMRGKIRCGIGHGGASYWTQRTFNGVEWGLGTEAFAEMMSATISNPESLATIKKYLPKSYAVFEEMLDVIRKNI